ncbi:MAG: hypothetical protein WA628_19180 [Terriglobales bacterium]
MPDPQAKDSIRPFEFELSNLERDRRTQVRSETTLSRIEDATYTILRKYEKRTA